MPMKTRMTMSRLRTMEAAQRVRRRVSETPGF
jgi:DNA-binding HxlR family transcriptional regulator